MSKQMLREIEDDESIDLDEDIKERKELREVIGDVSKKIPNTPTKPTRKILSEKR